jgi:hypothetical protein
VIHTIRMQVLAGGKSDAVNERKRSSHSMQTAERFLF